MESGTGTKAELLDLHNKESEAERRFSKNKVHMLAVLNEGLKKLREECDAAAANMEMANEKRAQVIHKIEDEIQLMEYKKENGNLTLAQLQELNDLKQQKHELEMQLEMHQAVLDKPDFKARIAETEAMLKHLKGAVSNAVMYMGKKNELLFQDLNMNRVKILLYEIVKSTGEIKDTFKFTYNDREYKRLSLSEKIRAGLEVAELIKKLSGRTYPTFIDNAESVCVIDNVRPASQLIFSIVEKGRRLTVAQKELALRKAA